MMLASSVVAASCVELSKRSTGTGKMSSSPLTIMLVVELLKLSFSFGSLFIHYRHLVPLVWSNRSGLLLSCVPAFGYAVSNSTFIHSFNFMPTVYALVLGNMKMPFTAVAHYLVFRRLLEMKQLLALLLIVFGALLIQLDPMRHCNKGGLLSENMFLGSIFVVISCIASAISGVTSEKILKADTSLPVHVENTKLYFGGALVTFLSLVAANSEAGVVGAVGAVFTSISNLNIFMLVYVCCHAANGLAVSLVLRELDIFAKTVNAALSMMLVAVTQYFFFGASITLEGGIGIGVICTSLFFYYETAISKAREKAVLPS
jgi:uncharacterized membrane protein